MQTKYNINDEVFILIEDHDDKYFGIFKINTITIHYDLKVIYECVVLLCSKNLSDDCEYLFSESEILGEVRSQKRHIIQTIGDRQTDALKKINEFYEDGITFAEDF